MKTILVPVDGSSGADKAVRFAADLARDTGATLTLFHVYDAPTAAQVAMARQTQDDFAVAMREVSASSFAAADRVLGAAAEQVAHEASIGHPAAEIVAKASELGADLVVMGCRGRSELQAYLLGSVSERVLRHAPCPVTVVR